MSSFRLYFGRRSIFMQVAAVGNLFLGSPSSAWSLAIIIYGFMYLKPRRGGRSVPVTKNKNFSFCLLGRALRYAQKSLM